MALVNCDCINNKNMDGFVVLDSGRNLRITITLCPSMINARAERHFMFYLLSGL